MNFRVSDEAKRDLRDIGRYIARDNPERAVSFVDELGGTIREAAKRPMSYPARDDLLPGLRSALHKPYLILFRVEADVVEIARVIHGARDLSAAFRS